MFKRNIRPRFNIVVISALIIGASLQPLRAAPGTLANSPLFLSTIVEPNVFFTVDDSGSMDWNPIIAQGTGGLPTASGLPYIDGRQRAYYTPSFSRLYNSRYVLPPADGTREDWDLGWMVRNHNANLNYYNPAVTYEPWPGTRADGSPMYLDADPGAALKDPFNPGGESVDLTRSYDLSEEQAQAAFGREIEVKDFWIAVYFVWYDVDGDGVIEQSDARKRVVIPQDSPGELQNFANWFQYHRSRIHAAKAIIGTTINNTDASRMGMRMFNYGQLANVASMSENASKQSLLENFYKYDVPARGTPMRLALKATGNYFDNTDSTAPILSAAQGGECQQNFNILIGDGFWNGSSPDIGNRDINGGTGVNDSEFDGNASESNDGGNYADGISNTLADVAMRNYERDLRPDLADKVQGQPGVDEAEHQHLVTYTISFGPIGTLDPQVDDPLAPGFSWPNPADGDAQKIDDMWHAAYNGRGLFLTASDPETLEVALGTAVSDIAERTATAAAVAVNSAQLTTESTVYVAEFNSNRWQGNLYAYQIADLDTGALATLPTWAAATELDQRNPLLNPRVIMTHDGNKGVPFRWDELDVAQQADLRTGPTGALEDELAGRARLEYLRGDRSNEGTGLFFRERLSLLADVVNSGPVFVGAPALNWPDTAPFPSTAGQRYSDFKSGPAASRQGVVYVGSNGGMMHGFAEDDGEEVLAYVANNLFSTDYGSGLHYLTDPNYGHRYYNDLTPTVSDVFVNLGSGSRWHSVLISGQRGGGRGIFALDVTNPNNFLESNAANIALWEFSSDDDPDLGYTFSRPQIGLANNGRWVAIFGNGYNDTGDGEAKLFIVDIEAGADGSWDAGDYIEISTGSGSPADRNGLSTPSLADLDGNGTIDRVWAGDLRGQMWSFDLTGTVPEPTPKLLFTTIDNRPITQKPSLAKHPIISDQDGNAPNVMVYFGTGQYLVDGDRSSTNDNHFYGIWDNGRSALDSGDLVEQTFQPGFVDSNGDAARVLSSNTVNYFGGDAGWYFALDVNGERSVTNSLVRAGIVFFNSFVPSSDPCSTGGSGFRFAVDMTNGGAPEQVAIDTNNDGLVDNEDMATDGLVSASIGAVEQIGYLPEPVIIEDISYTGREPAKVIDLKVLPKGRFSWQELVR